MQCPVCGVTAVGAHFKYIGAGKRICSSCQSILSIGYLCPLCDSITDKNPCSPGPHKNFLDCLRWLGACLGITSDLKLVCSSCGYKASFRFFIRIIFQDEKYCVMDWGTKDEGRKTRDEGRGTKKGFMAFLAFMAFIHGILGILGIHGIHSWHSCAFLALKKVPVK